MKNLFDINGKVVLPNGSSRKRINLGVKNEINTSVKNGPIDISIKVNDSSSWVSKSVVSPADYIKEVPSLNTEVNYRYNTKKISTVMYFIFLL